MQDAWTPGERRALARLATPGKVQDFLDQIPYTTDHGCRSPRRVLRDGVAHCFEGAMLAAAAFSHHGGAPLVMDLRAVRDDDHVLALFRQGGCWGAVAKSNFSGLRFREPVYRTLRELAVSYFEQYFNTRGEKTLRSHSRAVDLGRFDRIGWRTAEGDLDEIGDYLDEVPHAPLVTPAQVRALRRVDPRLLAAGLVGSDPKGLFRA